MQTCQGHRRVWGRSLYCASCDPTTHARVSLRDRRDTRSHTDHLLRHPDVHRPTVQGAAAVDGAHAGARPVRPGRQAHAALRHVQARRYRRVQAAARLRGPGRRDTPFIKRVIGLGGDARSEIRDGRRCSSTGTELSEDYTLRAAASRPAQPTTVSGDEHRWVIPAGELFLMGDHRQNSADSRTFAAGRDATQVIGTSTWLRYWPIDVSRDPAHAHPSGAGADRPNERPAVNPALAGSRSRSWSERVVAGPPGMPARPSSAWVIVDARGARSWPIRPAASAGPSPASPRRRRPGRLPAVGSRPRGHQVRTAGSLVGWPTDAFLALAAAVVEVWQQRPRCAGSVRRTAAAAAGSRWPPSPSCRSRPAVTSCASGSGCASC